MWWYDGTFLKVLLFDWLDLHAGSLPAQFIMEYMMEHVAKELNKDPTEIRKANFYQQGQVCDY